MNLAQQIASRYVYLIGILPGRVLRARSVATGDLVRAHLTARVVIASVPEPVRPGPSLAPPPQSATADAEALRDYERIRFAALQVDASCEVTEPLPVGWPGADVVWEPFRFVDAEAEEDQDAGALWVDRCPGLVTEIGAAVLRESAGAQGVARALTSFRGG